MLDRFQGLPRRFRGFREESSRGLQGGFQISEKFLESQGSFRWASRHCVSQEFIELQGVSESEGVDPMELKGLQGVSGGLTGVSSILWVLFGFTVSEVIRYVERSINGFECTFYWS